MTHNHMITVCLVLAVVWFLTLAIVAATDHEMPEADFDPNEDRKSTLLPAVIDAAELAALETTDDLPETFRLRSK